MNRVGHHIRQGIVEKARREVSDNGDSSDGQVPPGYPEPIPESQEEINAQADLAIRDLFPRIPNTDRQKIIEHSFRKVWHSQRARLCWILLANADTALGCNTKGRASCWFSQRHSALPPCAVGRIGPYQAHTHSLRQSLKRDFLCQCQKSRRRALFGCARQVAWR